MDVRNRRGPKGRCWQELPTFATSAQHVDHRHAYASPPLLTILSAILFIVENSSCRSPFISYTLNIQLNKTYNTILLKRFQEHLQLHLFC